MPEITNSPTGLQLSEALYQKVVKPTLENSFPHLTYAAALIGWGSEVLGYDDAVSTDHNWGPRLQLFLPAPRYKQDSKAILKLLDTFVPPTLLGYPTNFEISVPAHQRPFKDVNLTSDKHNIDIYTVPVFFEEYLGFEPGAVLRSTDWLMLSEHRLLTITSGRVFHDHAGDLHKARKKFAYYPDEVWRYLLAAQWAKLAEQEAFVGRSGDVRDELGSQLIAARQVRVMMRLCFLMERQYAPYSKWFGTAFAHLQCADKLTPIFQHILFASEWKKREQYLGAAYAALAHMHNQLALTPSVRGQIRSYYGRPYRVLFAGRFAVALYDTVQEKDLRAIQFQVGSINQIVDSEVKENPTFSKRLQGIFE